MRMGISKDLAEVQVIGIGQACVDYLGRLSGFPEEDSKAEMDALHIQCGGPASTALVTLSRLGIKTSFWGSISDDAFGKEIAKDLLLEGVDSTFLKITPGHTSQFAFIAVTGDSGKRTVLWHRGTVPPLTPMDIDLRPYSSAAILHLDGLMIEASLEAARQARARGLKVVLDAGTMREGSLELASAVDVLIASERFAEPLMDVSSSAEDDLDALSRLTAGDVVITRGSKGSIGLHGGHVIRQASYPIKAVDTTGAGDVYHGAYIYGMIQGWDMPDCMRFASAASALKCMKMGARRGIPYLTQIEELMRSNPAI